jgi:tRNA-dihydrouridine synthase
LARKLEEVGAQAFALHARFAVQGHSGEADWNLIAEIKRAVTKPVVGNGDIKTPQDAARMLAETGCDGVMIGRAAIGNPWILRDVVHYLRTGELLPPPTREERIAVALSHVCDLARLMGEERAVRHLRAQLPQYVRGHVGAPRVRERMQQAVTIAEVEQILASCGDPDMPV